MDKKTETKKAIKELTILLMYLNRFTDEKDFKTAKDFYAWKGYDFNIINELDDEDFIYQGKYRNKSVYITEKGIEEAKKLLEKYKIKDY
ncbi:DUF6429 family protein [Fusobacterium canifelinum]|uniref:DUF6429 domain-containing protein n=1 Tax=Fusobacterium canifelinum TaxID=285729 RepID=A0ABX7CEN8_9FUSO|nr:DUF6429 family protein [Fusobacterium canifelinum]QQS87978.1 hypothetical protein I6I83_02280 [Fusobacterium canifelinum]